MEHLNRHPQLNEAVTGVRARTESFVLSLRELSQNATTYTTKNITVAALRNSDHLKVLHPREAFL